MKRNWKWKILHTVLERRTVWFSPYKNRKLKVKFVMSWSSRKKKQGIFYTAYFVRRNFFNICVLSQCIMYWIHFQDIHTFTYQKILLHTLLWLLFKIVESLQCIRNFGIWQDSFAWKCCVFNPSTFTFNQKQYSSFLKKVFIF